MKSQITEIRKITKIGESNMAKWIILLIIMTIIMSFIILYSMVKSSKQRDITEQRILKNLAEMKLEPKVPERCSNSHIEKIIHISILNISPKTGAWLIDQYDSMAPKLRPIKLAPRCYLLEAATKTEELPPDIADCIAYARENRCSLIIFDEMEPVTAKLHDYSDEWTEDIRKGFF